MRWKLLTATFRSLAGFVVLLAVASVGRAETYLIDFVGSNYTVQGAEPPASPTYNVFDPPPTRTETIIGQPNSPGYRFLDANSGFTLGVDSIMIDNLVSSTGVSSTMDLRAIPYASSGVAGNRYSGGAYGGFAAEAVQDMLFFNGNVDTDLVLILDNLPASGVKYSLTFATRVDGVADNTMFTIPGRPTQLANAGSPPGTTTFNNVLPDGNGQIRISIGEDSSNVGWLSAMSIVTTTYTPGDANNDNQVTIDDFDVIASNFRNSVGVGTNGDLNFDGKVGFDDYAIWFDIANGLGIGADAGLLAPEPSAWSLVFLAAALYGAVGRYRSNVG